jgi:hypothetical protein
MLSVTNFDGFLTQNRFIPLNQSFVTAAKAEVPTKKLSGDSNSIQIFSTIMNIEKIAKTGTRSDVAS